MTVQTLDQRFAEAMGQLLGPDFPSELGLAVSGGGDSMAMLALAHNWSRAWGVRLRAITIDHGLRPESADEAAMVAQECATLGWPHDTLAWRWDGTGNVQDAARRGRLNLISQWRGTLQHVLMAHTADDVAETFLIRLARGSGVDGLAAMLPKREVADFTVVRPCLQMRRDELRHYAQHLMVPWAEDPSNDDPKYDRARARKILSELDGMGLRFDGITDTANRMRRAADALRSQTCEAARHCVSETVDGGLLLQRDAFAKLPHDIQLRLLASAIMWIGNADYRPRAAKLEFLLDRIMAGGASTLMGVKLELSGDTVRSFREYSAVATTVSTGIWDGRWRIAGPSTKDMTIQALGEGISDCPDWRDSGVPRAALMASPAIWAQGSVIAAPIAGFNAAWKAQIVTPFITYLLSH